MSKQEDIQGLVAHMDKSGERYLRTVADLNTRARPGEQKIVQCQHKKNGQDIGVPNGQVNVTIGKCPCSICGHEWLWECHETDCICCSVICT